MLFSLKRYYCQVVNQSVRIHTKSGETISIIIPWRSNDNASAVRQEYQKISKISCPSRQGVVCATHMSVTICATHMSVTYNTLSSRDIILMIDVSGLQNGGSFMHGHCWPCAENGLLFTVKNSGASTDTLDTPDTFIYLDYTYYPEGKSSPILWHNE